EQDSAVGAERESGEPRSLLECFELVAVDDDEVRAAKELRRHGAGGSRVEAEVRRLGRGRGDGFERDLQLAEHRVGLAYRALLGTYPRVRAWGDDDDVLAGRVDDDHRDPALAVVDPNTRDVDAFARERLERKAVRSDAADEAHVGPEARERDC